MKIKKQGFAVAVAAALLGGYAERALACWVYPLEALFRPFLKGPLSMPISSKSNAFAGLTTLGSGSASQTISTSVINSDSLVHLTVHAPLVAAYQTRGRTAVASGLATATVSTPAVYSGDNIQLTWESPNDITSGMALRVNSIVNGKSFAITTANGLTTIASGAVAMWNLLGKDPGAVKVNTISSNGFMTVGWADGVAKPVDATIMWEIRRGS
jgi:hypothetical protein